MTDELWERIRMAAETVRDGGAKRMDVGADGCEATIYAIPRTESSTLIRIDLKETK